MSLLAVSDSFEYLCYGSTTITNIFYSYSVGIDFSRQNLTSTGGRKQDGCRRPFRIFNF